MWTCQCPSFPWESQLTAALLVVLGPSSAAAFAAAAAVLVAAQGGHDQRHLVKQPWVWTTCGQVGSKPADIQRPKKGGQAA